MKVRSGFVSNSSSSSFIIAVAKVVNLPEAKKFADKNSNVSIVSVANILDGSERTVDGTMNSGAFVMESFTGDSISLDGLKTDDYIAVMEYYGGDDGDFWNEIAGEYDYDIVLDHFDSRNVKTALAFQEDGNGLEAGVMTYGAGRDG